MIEKLATEGLRIWPWPRDERYSVQEDGVIFGPRGKLRTSRRTKGYLCVRIAGMTIDVAIVVCETFHGPKPAPGMHAAHENGDKIDNRASNLSWKTPRENIADKKRHGTQPMGSKIVWSKLTEEDVREIRQKKHEGRSLASLGREYNVAYQTVQSAVSGRSWGHVQ